MLVTAAVGVGTTAASASHGGAVKCWLTAFMDFEPGVYRAPPGPTIDGSYSLTTVQFACAGTHGDMNGIGVFMSGGSTGSGNCGGVDYQGVFSFCGGYSTSSFFTGGGCQGSVGGNEMAMDTGPWPGNPASMPAHVASGDWSMITDKVISGGITCDSGSYAGGVGHISLKVVPYTVGVSGVVHVNGGCTPPDPYPGHPNPAAVYTCRVIANGVLVIHDPT
ncbi:MAG TPA: hypothetical protein VF230_00410 [Acidimicrobiales bacterium]